MLVRNFGLTVLMLSFVMAAFPQAVEKTNEDLNVFENDKELPPGFKSDGCTWFPDGNYRDCCEAHDLDYFKGGSRKERRASDKRLYRCVKSKKDWRSKFRAPLMYLGVRAFGVSFLPTPFRWGFGKKNIKARLRKAAESNDQKAPEESKPAENN